VKKLKIEEDLLNFVQGKIWKEKESKYFVAKDMLLIFLYYDDFEVNNPLEKYIFPCIPSEFTEKLENIFLCLRLFYSLDRDTYLNEKIFHIVMDEINYLQKKGITFEMNGSKITIYFALGLLLGDNLALNSALDYVSSFRTNYYPYEYIIKKKTFLLQTLNECIFFTCFAFYVGDFVQYDHHPAQKQSAINLFVHRALTIADKEHLQNST
ncbi:hypothetical protein ALC56_10544, partial [Trachymyrmex septentrionalis]